MSTFIHLSGKSQSQIDYILCMGDPRSSFISGVQVYLDPLNSSSHFPVKCVIPPVARGISGDKPSSAPVRRKFLWTRWISPNIEEYFPQN